MDNAGLGNYHRSEIEPGLIPERQNSPQRCPKNLYAEQISGSAFTKPRYQNFHSWLYRRLPSVVRKDFELYAQHTQFHPIAALPPNQFRWSPMPKSETKTDFVDGLFPFSQTTTNTVFLYQVHTSMDNRYFSNLDGEMLIVPHSGELLVSTEFGDLSVSPGAIITIPRGVYCKIKLQSEFSEGYACENRGAPLTLPTLGIIGANGLANPRHFIYPKAKIEDKTFNEATLINKFQGALWTSPNNHTPFNVAAWHGNYAPFCYDLSLFNSINTVSFDHPDPSIFTVLTSESEIPGVANLDFVIFPPRWMVADHSFRPPYFHRNIMSEWMGLIRGSYDAKSKGFKPGGVSVHNSMCPHGPDVESTQKAISAILKPEYLDAGLAFMFESKDVWQISEAAYNHRSRQQDYTQCWQGFTPGNL